MKIALIGAGRIGAFHATTLLSDDRVSALTIIDPSNDAAGALAQRLVSSERASQVQISTVIANDVSAALASFDTSSHDAVVVCAPTPYHASIVECAVSGGWPTFVEKPLAATLDEARVLAALCAERGARVQVGFQRRFDGGIASLQQRVASGELGTPYLARSVTHDADPPPPTYIEGPDGIFADTLVHDIDAIHFVMGQRIASVSARTADFDVELGNGTRTVQTATLQCTLADNTLAMASAIRHSPLGYDVRFEVHGSADALAAGHGPSMPLRLIDDAGHEERAPTARIDDFLVRFAPAYQAEMQAFLGYAQGAAGEVPGVHDGVAAQAVADAAWRSSSVGGAPVEVDHV